MNIERVIEKLVVQQWPELRPEFRERGGVPDATAHGEINALIIAVGDRSPKLGELARFRRLIGDPERAFGEIRPEDYRCQLTLLAANPVTGETMLGGRFEVVSHSWRGVLAACLAAKCRQPERSRPSSSVCD